MARTPPLGTFGRPRDLSREDLTAVLWEMSPHSWILGAAGWVVPIRDAASGGVCEGIRGVCVCVK